MDISDKSGKWMAIVNVYAASKKAGAYWAEAEKLLERYGVDFDSLSTGNGHNAMTLSLMACRDGYRKFIAAGGDGTIHDVLGGIGQYVSSGEADLTFSDFTIAVIPVGSGNDWIRTAGVPRDMAKAAALIGSGSSESRMWCVSQQWVLLLGMSQPMSRIWPMLPVWDLMPGCAIS